MLNESKTGENRTVAEVQAKVLMTGLSGCPIVLQNNTIGRRINL
jgi:hypothetical protein